MENRKVMKVLTLSGAPKHRRQQIILLDNEYERKIERNTQQKLINVWVFKRKVIALLLNQQYVNFYSPEVQKICETFHNVDHKKQWDIMWRYANTGGKGLKSGTLDFRFPLT